MRVSTCRWRRLTAICSFIGARALTYVAMEISSIASIRRSRA
jgi:hypothetical protein